MEGIILTVADGRGVCVAGRVRISAGGFSNVAVGVIVGESVMVGVCVYGVGVRVGGAGVNVRVGIGVRVAVLDGGDDGVLVFVEVGVDVGVGVLSGFSIMAVIQSLHSES